MWRSSQQQREAIQKAAMVDAIPQESDVVGAAMDALETFAKSITGQPTEASPTWTSGEGSCLEALRPDVVRDSLPVQQALANAKTSSGPFITVPKTFA